MINWNAAAAIGEIVAAIAVVLTLFYLARQIKDGATQLEINSLTTLKVLDL